MLQPWDKRETETATQYSAFCVYRDLGPDRSLPDACRQFYGGSTVNIRQLEKWSAAKDWVERAEAYSADLELKAREMVERDHPDDLAEFRAKQLDLAKRARDAALDMLAKCCERLESIDPDEIAPKDLPRFFRAAAYVAEAASNGEAQALSIGAILDALTDSAA